MERPSQRGAVRRRVLIVDDEMINREILGNMLKDIYDVEFAENGKQAYEILCEDKDRYSLMLLDLLMPVMDGRTLLEMVRQDSVFDKMPIIVMTQESEAEVESIKAGAADFISKPYKRPEIILARCERIIDLYEQKTIISETERDPLTGLYSREFFFEYVRRIEQYALDISWNAVVIDIEHFHLINEIYGRKEGNVVLRKIADVIESHLDDIFGMACRIDADTFYACLSDNIDTEQFAEDIIRETEGISLTSARIRLRVGIYNNVDRNEPPETWFDHAKIACNHLRGDYANQVAYYDSELHKKQVYHERLISDIDDSIKNRDFIVYYQPKYAIQHDTPQLKSAEALIRWDHPELGMISPGDFIPLFEKNGLIQKLDRYVWEEACRQIGRWKDKFGITIPVSVNVSRIDIYEPDLEDCLFKILDDNGIQSSDLMLEITESAYADNAARLIEVIDHLRSEGFLIEMDDFGSGYSSLNMVTTLPIDVLKMDMKFVRNMLNDDKSLKLVELVMDIAKFLKVPVVAEGVEEQQQLDILRDMGCEVIQGYYFSKPVTSEEFETFIEKELERQHEQEGGDLK